MKHHIKHHIVWPSKLTLPINLSTDSSTNTSQRMQGCKKLSNWTTSTSKLAPFAGSKPIHLWTINNQRYYLLVFMCKSCVVMNVFWKSDLVPHCICLWENDKIVRQFMKIPRLRVKINTKTRGVLAQRDTKKFPGRPLRTVGNGPFYPCDITTNWALAFIFPRPFFAPSTPLVVLLCKLSLIFRF